MLVLNSVVICLFFWYFGIFVWALFDCFLCYGVSLLVCLFCCVSRLVVLFGGGFMLDSVSRCCFVDIGY